MTNSNAGMFTIITDIGIAALSKRVDPLITRVNAGEYLNNEEATRVLQDLYDIAALLKTSAETVDAAMAELDKAQSDNNLMKQLLGLKDDAKTDKYDEKTGEYDK